MVSIQVDDSTAQILANQAFARGLSVADYVRTLVRSSSTGARPNWDELESQFLALSTPAPSLPADFSRADIYADHD